nr:hypothetical protein [Angustibacter aerolatus]
MRTPTRVAVAAALTATAAFTLSPTSATAAARHREAAAPAVTPLTSDVFAPFQARRLGRPALRRRRRHLDGVARRRQGRAARHLEGPAARRGRGRRLEREPHHVRAHAA